MNVSTKEFLTKWEKLDRSFNKLYENFKELAKLIRIIIESKNNGLTALNDFDDSFLLTGDIYFVTLGKVWKWRFRPIMPANDPTAFIGNVIFQERIIFNFDENGDTNIIRSEIDNTYLNLYNIDDVTILITHFIYENWDLFRDAQQIHSMDNDFSKLEYIFKSPSKYV